MDKICGGLNNTAITSEKPRGYINMEVFRLKDDYVSKTDMKDWEENMEESISPIFTNIMSHTQCREGEILSEGNLNGG